MRRNLEEVKRELRGGVLIFTCALRKDFARKPAYWIEIYRVPRGPAVVYVAAKQWGFMKSGGEKVQDAACSNTLLSMKSAMNYVAKALEAKIEAGWMMCEEEFDSSPPATDPQGAEVSAIQMFCHDWENKQTLPKQHRTKVTRQKPKTPAEKFKDAQQKRRAKAEW
jgi:hypothetical protein